MRLMNLDPTKSSGWFAYHLRLLIDVGLLKKEEENNFVYYSLSDAGKKTVLFLDEVGREMSVSYTIINFFERLSLFNQVEACWGLIFLLYSLLLILLPLKVLNPFSNYLGYSLLILFIAIESHLAYKIRSSAYFLLLNVYWLFLKPPKWKELGVIVTSGMLSAVTFGVYISKSQNIYLFTTIILLLISAIATFYVIVEDKKYHKVIF